MFKCEFLKKKNLNPHICSWIINENDKNNNKIINGAVIVINNLKVLIQHLYEQSHKQKEKFSNINYKKTTL